VLVTKEGGERLQAAVGEPKTLRWFDGGHGESPPALFDEAREFLAFVRQLAALRASEPALTRHAFLDGPVDGVTDVRWLHPNGREMAGDDWGDPERRVLAVQLRDTVLILFNASVAEVPFTLPAVTGVWRMRANTAEPTGWSQTIAAGALLTLPSRSMAVLTALQ